MPTRVLAWPRSRGHHLQSFQTPDGEFLSCECQLTEALETDAVALEVHRLNTSELRGSLVVCFALQVGFVLSNEHFPVSVGRHVAAVQ